jgi:hypothetical protein
MLLFINPAIDTSTPNAAARSGKDGKLKIDIPEKADQKVKFEFTNNEMVVNGSANFTILLEHTHIGGKDPKCYIAGFCSTETDLNIVSATEYIKHDQTKPPVKTPKPVAYLANGHHKRFDDDTKELTFAINLPPRKLAFIGLIVAISFDGDGNYVDYLFDPQVGNGPPPTNATGTGGAEAAGSNLSAPVDTRVSSGFLTPLG